MPLSNYIMILPTGMLVYLGQNGQLYEIVGGTNGQLNLRQIR